MVCCDKNDRLEKVVELSASISRVWSALTDPDEFGRWFQVRLDNGFAVGTTTTGVMTHPGHEHVKWISVTEAMEPERLFAFSWPPALADPDTVYDTRAKVRVEFQLEALEAGTRLTVIESGFLCFPDHKRLDILRANAEGWELQLRNVKAYAESD